MIVPYNSASQSGIIIDAYKFSRPVIAFDVGAIVEQIDEGKSGFIVPSGDNHAFAKVLRQAVSMDKQKYHDMCSSAYEFGSKKYAASGSAERFIDLITKQ